METSDGLRVEKSAGPSNYRAPALEKGLDILELLAAQSEGLILSQIAQRLDRSVQEVYRVVISLERRGYVSRSGEGDAFQLSMKLFDLASNHMPMRRLLRVARPVLDQLAMKVEQLVILSVRDGWNTRVMLVAEDPAPIGFRVRVGTPRRIPETASGRTLLAFQPPEVREALLTDLSAEARAPEFADHIGSRIDDIRRRGYELIRDETLHGITDVSFPIVDAGMVAHAVLTMPYLVWVENEVQLHEAGRHLFESARALSRKIDGDLPEPEFPLRQGTSPE